MIEQRKSDAEIQEDIDSAMNAHQIYMNQIIDDQQFRENLPQSSQLIIPKDGSKEAVSRARSEARSCVRREKTAVVFDSALVMAYVYEPTKPMRIVRGNPMPPPDEQLNW